MFCLTDKAGLENFGGMSLDTCPFELFTDAGYRAEVQRVKVVSPRNPCTYVSLIRHVFGMYKTIARTIGMPPTNRHAAHETGIAADEQACRRRTGPPPTNKHAAHEQAC